MKMGVKELWSLLTPFCEKKPLYELEGKTIAIDLACWICEALTVVEYNVQPRFYVRNLYFRTYHLLLLGVHPVFILDGKAPTLKYDTIAARNEIQFKGARPRKPNANKVAKDPKDRSRFNSVLKQCEELLNIIGIKCVHGWGEAEAMCAYLNEDKFVDGCITQDSDCFVYGAQIVFRNFSLSQQGATANKGGSVDVYDIKKVPNLGRNKMVALALLCGCDYNAGGVNGIGRDSAMKFLNCFGDDVILDRIKSWKTDAEKFRQIEREINSPDICTACGHSGKVQKHTKNGCLECKTPRGCDSSIYKEKRLLMKNELNIRSKALVDDNFPNQELIDEFLIRKGKMPTSLDLSWRQPNLVSFVKYVGKMIDWSEIYAIEKFLPLLTRWQLLNYEYVKNNAQNLKGVLFPDFITKKCRPKGIVSYEIVWKDKDNYFQGLIPDHQINEWMEHNKEENTQKIWSTVEPENWVIKAYPDLVQTFLDSKIKKKKKPEKRKKIKTADIDELNDSLSHLCVSKKPTKSVKKINEYFGKLTAKNDNENRITDRENFNSEMIDELNDSLSQLCVSKKPEKSIKTNKSLRNSLLKNNLGKRIPDKENLVPGPVNHILDSIDDLNDSLDQLYVSNEPIETVEKCSLKKDYEKIIPVRDKTILNSRNSENCGVENSNKIEEHCKSLDLNCSNLSNFDEDSELNLSEIVESIVNKGSLNLLQLYKA